MPIGYYSKGTGKLDVWTSVPTLVYQTIACVTNIAVSDDGKIFFAGSFSVTLPGTATDSYAVVYFDSNDKQWKDIQIPQSIGAYSYAMNALAVSTFNNQTYVAFGGNFEFTVDGNTYNSFAVYNLATSSWVNVPQEFSSGSIVDSIVMDGVSDIYVAGDLVVRFLFVFVVLLLILLFIV